MFWLTPITRSPAQKPAHKDLGRNDQRPVITPKATYVLAYAHNALPKDLSRNGQSAAITPEATYTPTSKRAGSRSLNLPPVDTLQAST
ncbi:hypothetical protein [Lacticaseibacillus rhamnosus]|uniref:hypothetical protein n=1 Tax=Lacticaseibacillus rhamnosus TaxID=47715 RepID=UPI001ED9A67A|nr:hypothetical protein [Lacticaseibacillus rhamnosus]